MDKYNHEGHEEHEIKISKNKCTYPANIDTTINDLI